MTVISTKSATGASVTFSGIPGGFDALVVDLGGVSFAGAGGQTGRITISNPGGNSGLFTGSQGIAPASGLGAATGVNMLWACAGGISAIRISAKPGDSFDAGSITLSGV
jgi:hypothetical protein